MTSIIDLAKTVVSTFETRLECLNRANKAVDELSLKCDVLSNALDTSNISNEMVTKIGKCTHEIAKRQTRRIAINKKAEGLLETSLSIGHQLATVKTNEDGSAPPEFVKLVVDHLKEWEAWDEEMKDMDTSMIDEIIALLDKQTQTK